MTTIREMIKVLETARIPACPESLAWLATLNPDASVQEAWDACPNEDWRRWLALDLPEISTHRGCITPEIWAEVLGRRTFSEVWAAFLEAQIRA